MLNVFVVSAGFLGLSDGLLSPHARPEPWWLAPWNCPAAARRRWRPADVTCENEKMGLPIDEIWWHRSQFNTHTHTHVYIIIIYIPDQYKCVFCNRYSTIYNIYRSLILIPHFRVHKCLFHPHPRASHWHPNGIPWQVVISVIQESDEAFRRRKKFSAARLELFECPRGRDRLDPRILGR